MLQYSVVQAERISADVEGNIADLIDKLCEGEPQDVRSMVWSMVATRIAFLSGRGDCFQLPPLDEC